MTMQSAQCPFCGLTVVKDDEAQAIAHQEPECEKFATMVASTRPSETREVQEEAVGAHFAALRRRVASRRN